jgi:pyruvate dehydrogenase E2 component (dihydrolipoamide acetyltransferase)
MAIYEVTIPQVGEGLQEARLIRLLKRPGDAIARDEPIFEMETDKATMEIESPVGGRLVEWVVAEDSVVPVGSVVGRVEADEAEAARATGHRQPAIPPADAAEDPAASVARARNAVIPPRTRAYARERGISDAELVALADRLGARVMPADVDRYAAEKAAEGISIDRADYDLEPLPPSQRTLVYRLQQRAGEVIPATEETLLPWTAIDRARSVLKHVAREKGHPVPTPFVLLAWCVVRAADKHPVFRCTYAGDGMLRRHPHLNLGLAVAREADELLTAVVEAAETLSFGDFASKAAEAIKDARAGADQATSTVQMSLSNLSGHDILRATPVVVAPAIATLFLGSVHLRPVSGPDGSVTFERVAAATLTFDHRVINGVGAARFLSTLREHVEGLAPDLLLG